MQLPIDGLDCPGSGAIAIEKALASRPGVLRAYVNPATEMAYIDFDPGITDEAAIVRVVEVSGYRAGWPVET